VVGLGTRVSLDNALLIITAAYTGMRWGEPAGLQWDHTNLDDGEIVVDQRVGALHEIRGRLELGPFKTPASVRTVHLPPFHLELLTQLRRRHPDAWFVFAGPDGGLHRRSNFRRRVWLPALTDLDDVDAAGRQPIQPGMHFHDLRHTQKTWLIEDRVCPRSFNTSAWAPLRRCHGRLLPRHPPHDRQHARRRAGQMGANWEHGLERLLKVLQVWSRSFAPNLRPKRVSGQLTMIVDGPLSCRNIGGRYWDRTSDLFGVN
jgi:hypothetical protein